MYIVVVYITEYDDISIKCGPAYCNCIHAYCKRLFASVVICSLVGWLKRLKPFFVYVAKEIITSAPSSTNGRFQHAVFLLCAVRVVSCCRRLSNIEVLLSQNTYEDCPRIVAIYSSGQECDCDWIVFACITGIFD